jgi:archaemetzincin
MDTDRFGILLVPIGDVESGVLHHLARALRATFGLPCRTTDQIERPAEAYDPSRGQYRGQDILRALDHLELPDAERVLGVIDADCYALGLNSIFGQAQRYGRNAFISLSRLLPPFYGELEDGCLFRERAVKEAVHELGHTYGLDHCSNPRCVMHFSNRLLDTDVKRATFCERCLAKLRGARSD